MSKTFLSYLSPQVCANETTFILRSPRSSYKIQVELFNCTRVHLQSVKKVICLHSTPHSVALFLKMKDQADLAVYCHPLLAFKEEKEYVFAYTSKLAFPLAILTVVNTLDNLFVQNGVPTHFRRWCTRIFKIQATKLFFRRMIPSGVVEYIGIQAHHSKSRSAMDPRRCRDPKSSQSYTIYREYPIFTLSEQDNLTLLKILIPANSSQDIHGNKILFPFRGWTLFYAFAIVQKGS